MIVALATALATPWAAKAWSPDTDLGAADVSLWGEAAQDSLHVLPWVLGDVNGDSQVDILAGAPWNDTGDVDAGAVYVILGPLGGWGADNLVSSADCRIRGDAANALAGWTVDGSGDVDGDGADDILIGAPLDGCAGDSTGRMHLLFGSAAGWAPELSLVDADASFCGEAEGDEVAYAVAYAGDVDGDGLDDFVAGAPYSDEAGHHAGTIYLHFGDQQSAFAHDSMSSADASFTGHQTDVMAGGALSTAGDVNGDGLADLLIGNAVEGGSWEGWTYLVLGRTSGWSQGIDLGTSDASFVGETPGDDAGNAVAAAGDVNGDGFDDFLIGAPYSSEVASVAGQVYLVLGRPSGWAPGTSLSSADASFLPQFGGDVLGWSVAGVGDVNGDGLDDFMVGAPGNGEYQSEAGQAYLFFGDLGGWAVDTSVSEADASFIGEVADDRAAWSVGGSGDLNGDGFDDLLIGAPHNDEPGADAGQIYVVYGGACEDSDGDGYGDPGDPTCPGGPDPDCDDNDSSVHPGASEDCNGVDDDCDGSIPADEEDADQDGYRLCELDCDDTNESVHPDAGEVCDGLDNDCDGSLPVWDVDEDGDGHSSCAGDCNDADAGLHIDDEDGDGYSPCEGDCDDTDAALHLDDMDGDGASPCDGDCDDEDAAHGPDAPEQCDGQDNDCDGELPPEEQDNDGDGVMECSGDCDDGQPDAHPGAVEVCDGFDNDCDGLTDDVDEDGDGFMPVGCGGEDCDDADADVNTQADEDCEDGADNDCDGLADEYDPDCMTDPDDDDTQGDDDIVGDDAPPSPEGGCECVHSGKVARRPGPGPAAGLVFLAFVVFCRRSGLRWNSSTAAAVVHWPT